MSTILNPNFVKEKTKQTKYNKNDDKTKVTLLYRRKLKFFEVL